MAFFFSAIGTQGPKKAPKKNKNNLEDNGEESDSEHFTTQLSSSLSQSWISSHPALVNKKLLYAINYWIALNTPNGAPANPITIHRALLECGVHAIANTVRFPFAHHKLIALQTRRSFKNENNNFTLFQNQCFYSICPRVLLYKHLR